MSEEKRGQGRPCKLTPVLQEKIVNAVAAGNYADTAAALAGISKGTFFAWIKKGARSHYGKFRDFSDAIEKAQAESEVRDLRYIGQAAAAGSWQAAAWRLEQKFPKRWGRVDRSEVTGKDGGPVEVKGEYHVEHSLDADAECVADSLLRLAERLLGPEASAEPGASADGQ